jgi:RNA recognition motif-containing protein
MQLSVKKLYLGGVKEPLTETDLKDYFSKYGAVTDAIVMKDREGQYRGYAFIYICKINSFKLKREYLESEVARILFTSPITYSNFICF